MKKRVLFAAPTYLNLHKILIQNLEIHGFEVTSICMDEDFKYSSIKERFTNLFHKTILNNPNYKKDVLYDPYKSKELTPKLNNYPNNFFDYSLVIRPDIYPLNVLSRIKEISNKTIGYQWDGLNRFPKIFNRIPLFDSFFVFDKNDYYNFQKKYSNIKYIDNFFSNFDFKFELKKEKKIDIFYLGSYDDERMLEILKVYKLLAPLNLKIKITLNSNKKKVIEKFQNKDITFSQKTINYEENLAHVFNAKVLLDFKFNTHNGLSFRFFECLKYETKIITNNTSIKKYDFYHPNNIFILGQDLNSDLENFIKSPYIKIDKNIKNQYSFTSWIDKIIQ